KLLQDHYISVVTSSPAYQQVQEALASVASYLGINKGDAAAAAGISTTAATAMVASNGRGGASRWAALNTPETRRLLLSLAGTGLSVLVAWLVLRRLLSELADPASKDHAAAKQAAARILRAIGADPSVRLTDYELVLAADLVDPAGLDATWADIGGLDEAIAELRESVVLPLRHPRLAERSRLLQPPKGVLLYGPPGCGKTLIAKATAKAAGARFLNVRLSSLFDKWVGESEKRVEALFSLAQKLQPVIVFVDELDSFLGNRDRMGGGHECSEKVKTQFMTFWDGLLTRSDSRVVVMGATNRRHAVDAAILRRLPCQVRIGLPDEAQRLRILEVLLAGEPIGGDVAAGLNRVAAATPGLSGSDLRELCRLAAVGRLRRVLAEAQGDADAAVEAAVSQHAVGLDDLLAAAERLRIASGVGELGSASSSVDVIAPCPVD
uniref:AAA domain-containing protein n=1 Tax=Macrostomum lignano TaxID=282301 RepID=A0A1I8GX81_9PLAT